MNCTNCGKVIHEGTKFCGNCGTSISANVQEQHCSSDNTVRGSTSTKNRTYHNKADRIKDVENKVKEILVSENLEIQVINERNCTIIQAKQPTKIWKRALGLEIAAIVTLEQKGNDLLITQGAGKWADKAIGGAVAWFVFWPAILTTSWGIYLQQKLFKRIDNELINFLT